VPTLFMGVGEELADFGKSPLAEMVDLAIFRSSDLSRIALQSRRQLRTASIEPRPLRSIGFGRDDLAPSRMIA